MSTITFIGLLAGTLTTVCFVPQVVRTVRLRQTRDLSLWMYLCSTTGIILWLIYGFLLHDLPIILANAVSLFLAGTILILKIKHG